MSKDKAWAKYGEALRARLAEDRSFKESLDTMPSAFTHTKHIEWIITSYLAGGVRLYEDIKSRVYPALDDHAKLLRNRLLSKGDPAEPWTDETNLLNYCGLRGCQAAKKATVFQKPGLEQLLDKYRGHLTELNAPAYRPDPGSLFFNGKDVRIYKLRNREEACYYGRGTKWCTAASKNNMFEGYNRDSILYVIIPKKPRYEGEKYQIAIERVVGKSDSGISDLMDEGDEEVELDDLISLYPEIRQIEAIDRYLRYGYIAHGEEIDGYVYYVYVKELDQTPDSIRTVIRLKNNEVTDMGVIDPIAKKLDMVQGTIEAMADGLVLALKGITAPWLATLLYRYRPKMVLEPGPGFGDIHYNAVNMLQEQPVIMADAIQNHYESVYKLLIHYTRQIYRIDIYKHWGVLLSNVIDTVTKKHHLPKLHLKYQIGDWMHRIAYDYENDDEYFTKLRSIIRAEIDRSLPGKDKHVLDELEKDLYDNIIIFMHEQEDNFAVLESLPYSHAPDFRKAHHAIKFLYTALAAVPTPLPPRVVRYSLISIRWVELHK